jgi:hypothetical protein
MFIIFGIDLRSIHLFPNIVVYPSMESFEIRWLILALAIGFIQGDNKNVR